MPPSHGGAIVSAILRDETLRQSWEEELETMRNRINSLRVLWVDKLKQAGADRDFSFIAEQYGMFSFLGISPEQVRQLRDSYGIYMVDSSRINIAGVSQDNVDYLAAAIVKTISQ